MTATMTTTQAAAICAVSLTTIRRWCRAAKIAATKAARRWLIDPRTLPTRIHQENAMTSDTITLTATVGDTAWTIIGNTKPNPLAAGPAIKGIAPNGSTVWLDCQYRQITSVRHTDGCAWGTRVGSTCSCAPQPVDVAALFQAARDVSRRCSAAHKEAEAAEAARLARTDTGALVRVSAGCEGCPSAIHGGVCTCC